MHLPFPKYYVLSISNSLTLPKNLNNSCIVKSSLCTHIPSYLVFINNWKYRLQLIARWRNAYLMLYRMKSVSAEFPTCFQISIYYHKKLHKTTFSRKKDWKPNPFNTASPRPSSTWQIISPLSSFLVPVDICGIFICQS